METNYIWINETQQLTQKKKKNDCASQVKRIVRKITLSETYLCVNNTMLKLLN